jgi:lipoate-protein ligase A
MKFLDLTLPGSANLACDEALLDACDDNSGGEVLRFWEPVDYFVVVGYANHIEREVNADVCRDAGVGIYRRCSGGGTVLQGPGCLNYSLVLRIAGHHPVGTITSANRYVMEQHARALGKVLRAPVEVCGITDLAIDGRKFSGNAQRRKREALIFHGTFLLGMDFEKVSQFLAMPSREPEYRANRSHKTFMTNIPAPAAEIKEALRECWNAREPLDPAPKVSEALRQKYLSDDWNLKF